MIMRYLAGIGALAIILTICIAAQLHPRQPGSGGQWLSWSASERDTYVDGFISGYLEARLVACDASDHLFEVGQPHRLGDEQHPTEMPSGRCLASVDTYTKYKYTNSAIDFSAYTNAITEFYTKYPEYQAIPVPNLMEFLSDKKYRTADQLYEAAKRREVHPIR
jgi:hypothetical protein